MIEPLISVIMPAYNAQKYIAESIESVTAQTWQNWELIIADDGSTDDTAAIIKKYCIKDLRIKYTYLANSGPGPAKNAAIAKSEGVYVAFLDSDDLWVTDKLRQSYQAIQTGDHTLIFTNCYVFHDEKDITKLHTIGVEDKTYIGVNGVKQFIKRNRIPNLTVLAKKEAILATGGFSGIRVAEDYELWLKMLVKGYSFKSLSAPLSSYRVHHESITAIDRHAYLEVIQILKALAKDRPEYAAICKKVAAEKIKHWLYTGRNRSAKKYRELINDTYNKPSAAFFGLLSLLLPLNLLKKIVSRAY